MSRKKYINAGCFIEYHNYSELKGINGNKEKYYYECEFLRMKIYTFKYYSTKSVWIWEMLGNEDYWALEVF